MRAQRPFGECAHDHTLTKRILCKLSQNEPPRRLQRPGSSVSAGRSEPAIADIHGVLSDAVERLEVTVGHGDGAPDLAARDVLDMCSEAIFGRVDGGEKLSARSSDRGHPN